MQMQILAHLFTYIVDFTLLILLQNFQLELPSALTKIYSYFTLSFLMLALSNFISLRYF